MIQIFSPLLPPLKILQDGLETEKYVQGILDLSSLGSSSFNSIASVSTIQLVFRFKLNHLKI